MLHRILQITGASHQFLGRTIRARLILII